MDFAKSEPKQDEFVCHSAKARTRGDEQIDAKEKRDFLTRKDRSEVIQGREKVERGKEGRAQNR